MRLLTVSSTRRVSVQAGNGNLMSEILFIETFEQNKRNEIIFFNFYEMNACFTIVSIAY